MKKKLVALLLVAMLAFGLAACTTGTDTPPTGGEKDGIKIGISLPTQREERWVLDKEAFEKNASETGIEIAIQIADNNATTQQSQCENLISQGIDVLICAPHDGDAAVNIVEMAHEAGIPVIAYDRPIMTPDLDLYVTFDQYEIGKLMGQYMVEHLESGNIVFLKGDPGDPTCVPLAQGAKDAIQAKVDSGDYVIVMEQDVKDWDPVNALKIMENALTANDNNIQGVIAPNDGTAGAVVEALAAQGMADGSVIVTGQDSEVDAIKRIIEGTQSMTVFFDVRDLAGAAFGAAVTMANGQAVRDDGIYEEDGISFPQLVFPPAQVTIDNYKELLLDSGYMDPKDLD